MSNVIHDDRHYKDILERAARNGPDDAPKWTKTPWQLGPVVDDDCCATDGCDYEGYGQNSRLLTWNCEVPIVAVMADDRRDANAARILHCVNNFDALEQSHERLLERNAALVELLARIESEYRDERAPNSKRNESPSAMHWTTMESIRAALVAGGEK